MKEMKWWMDIVKNLTMLTQFSFTLVTPLLMCLGICWLLCAGELRRLDLYSGIFLWYGGSGMVAWRALCIRDREAEKGRDEKTHFL